MNDLRDSAFALREAQRAYMADRGNEAKGKAVAAAAERLDAAIAAVDAGQAGRVHRMVAENDALRNAIGSRVDAALSAAQPEGGEAVLWVNPSDLANPQFVGINAAKAGHEQRGKHYTLPLYTRPAPAQQAVNPVQWLRDNYHAFPNIASLCDAMTAALASNAAAKAAEGAANSCECDPAQGYVCDECEPPAQEQPR